MATFITLYGKNNGGGYFIRLCRIITTLSERGHRVIYISPDKFPVSGKNIIFCRLPRLFKGKLNHLYFLLASMIIVPFIGKKESKLDAIIVFDALYALPFIFFKYATKTPLLTFIRGNLVGEQHAGRRGFIESKIVNFIYRIGLLISDRVIFNSPIVMRDINSYFNFSFNEVIPNDIDTIKFYKIDHSRKNIIERNASFCVGYIGVLVKIKNVELLIKAVSNLIYEGYNLKLILIGDGPYQVNLMSLAKELGIEHYCDFQGWRDDVNSILNNSVDLLILPSKSEGAPNVLLEALGAGTLCIGSDIPPIRDLLHFSELLFKFDIKALTDKIRHIIDDESYRIKLMKYCTERRSHFVFNWEDRVEQSIMKSITLSN